MNTLLIVSGVGLSALAQVLVKSASKTPLWSFAWVWWMALSIFSYATSFFAYSFLLRKNELSRLSPIMSSGVAILVAVAGILLFGEQINARKGLGICMGIIAILLLST
jgi:drug/metabolite transporter (DMT)-like permease